MSCPGGGHGGRSDQPGKEKINFMFTNCQSIPSKISELDAVSVDLKPDVILLCETWCNNNTSLSIKGYEIVTDLRRDRCDTANGIGGGLIVYVREDLAV